MESSFPICLEPLASAGAEMILLCSLRAYQSLLLSVLPHIVLLFPIGPDKIRQKKQIVKI